MLLVLSSFTVSSQDDRRNRRARRDAAETVSDSTIVQEISDSLRAFLDSTARADSLFAADSINMLQKSSLEAPAFTTARDSIIEDFSDGKRMIYYYGDVSVTYANMKLTADYMEYDLKSQTLYARGTKDSTGVITGQPVMEQGSQSYTMEEVRYNFETRKAFITNMITQEQDGILQGKNIKMMPDHSINITNGKYTV
jgi:lipopolysaccharide assembly outer membrane protein LptD (OstA)